MTSSHYLVVIRSNSRILMRAFLLFAALASVSAFRWGGGSLQLSRLSVKGKVTMTSPPVFENPFVVELKDDAPVSCQNAPKSDGLLDSALIVAMAPLLCLLFWPQASFADSSDFGILTGRTASMLHPVTNFALFGTSLYSAFLGWQWRRLRSLGSEIKNLSSNLPLLATTRATFPVKPLIETLKTDIERIRSVADGGDSGRVALIEADIRLLEKVQHHDQEYLELTAARDSLKTKDLKDKHHNTGSILLGAGVSVSILGALNTYMRAGRLFPGPHLYAGMAITILWALAAALVPHMQKGNETARLAHIGLNIINIALFAYQIPTGIEIMLKVWEKTSWP